MFRFCNYKNTLYLNTKFVFSDFFAFMVVYLSIQRMNYLFFMSKIVLFGICTFLGYLCKKGATT